MTSEFIEVLFIKDRRITHRGITSSKQDTEVYINRFIGIDLTLLRVINLERLYLVIYK
jgi:hypothetical protein